MRLALAAGRVLDPDAFAAEMPAGLLRRWEAFDRLEGGGRKDDWTRTAMLCASVFNASPFRGGGPPARLADFLPAALADAPPRSRPSRRAERELLGLAGLAATGGLKVYGRDGEAIDPIALLRLDEV